MDYYFIAKTENGEFVGQFKLNDIVRQFRAGDLPGDYVAAKATGLSYRDAMKSRTPLTWTNISVLCADIPVLSEGESTVPSGDAVHFGSAEETRNGVVPTHQGSTNQGKTHRHPIVGVVRFICWAPIGLFVIAKLSSLMTSGLTVEWMNFTEPSRLFLLCIPCAVILVVLRLLRSGDWS